MAEHVCPVWVGRLLANPLRRLLVKPENLLGPYVKEGMTVLEPGPAMGFFTIPMAKMVGQNGRVICVDIQEKMFPPLLMRAKKEGIAHLIETRVCSTTDLGVQDLAGKIDFALAFAMVHEVPDVRSLLAQINNSLRMGGKLLIGEPKFHVSKKLFQETLRLAREVGFSIEDSPGITQNHSVLLAK